MALIELGPLRGEKVFGVKRGVSQEFKSAAMQSICARLGHDIHDAAAVISVFRIEIVGQHTKLGDRIQIGDDRSAAVHQFLDIPAIHDESVGVFTLAADRLVAGVQPSRGRNGNGGARHDNRIRLLRRHGHDSRLKSQKIGETSSVQGDCRDLRTCDNFTHLRTLCFHMHGAIGNDNFFRLLTHCQGYVFPEGRINVNNQARALVGLESITNNFNFIPAHGQIRECVGAVRIGPGCLLNGSIEI